MKILALVTDAFGHPGGIAEFNREIFYSLADIPEVSRIDILPQFAENNSIKLPPNMRQFSPANNKLNYGFRAFSLALAGHYDFIFCGHLNFSPLAVLLGGIFRLPVWMQIHGIEAWQKPSPQIRAAVPRLTLVTSSSRHTRRIFLSWADLEPEKVRVLHPIVGDSFFPGPKPQALLQSYSLSGKRIMLSVARLSTRAKYKGVDQVLFAMPRLVETFPNLVYLIAGEGDDRPRLESIAAKLGITDYVRFIGFVPDKSLPDLYRLADLFVMPSSGEGFGIVFIEAAACATPAIAGDSDGSCDALHDGEWGGLVSPDRIAPVAESILTLRRRNEYASVEARRIFSKTNLIRQLGPHLQTLCRAKRKSQ